jgi:hypothetical protein
MTGGFAGIGRWRGLQSAELSQILKQKPAGEAAANMKRCAALIESSEFDWSKAKLGRCGRDGCAGIGVIARPEHDLLFLGRIRPKLGNSPLGRAGSRQSKNSGMDCLARFTKRQL